MTEAERRAAWERKMEANIKALAVYVLSCENWSVSAESHEARLAIEKLAKGKK